MKMQKPLFLIIILVFTICINAQKPKFEWAKKLDGNKFNEGQSLVLDSSGNIYTIGHFQDIVDFDPGIGTLNLTSSGELDIFISKLDTSGNLLWVKQIGGILNDFGYSIELDGYGNIYATGHFSGTIDFDPGMATYYLSATSDKNIFILKLDSSGNFIWAKNIGGAVENAECSIAVKPSGNSYTIGTFSGKVDFNPDTGIYNLSANGQKGIFILKLDGSGNFLWAKQMSGNSYASGNAIVLDSTGNIYTTGFFSDTVDFNPDAGTFNLISAGLTDVFISKLDSSGTFIWAKQMGGISRDEAISIALDKLGNIYTTGTFYNISDFDPGVGIFNLQPSGIYANYDIFISKLDAGGNFVWAKSMGGTSLDKGFSITVDVFSNVFITGSFQDTADFDPGIGKSKLSSYGYEDIFILKLNTTGNFIWAGNIGGTMDDIGQSIKLDKLGNLFLTGSFGYIADFDPGSGIVNLITSGSQSTFVLKLSQDGTSNMINNVINKAFSLYPNPTNSTFNLTLYNPDNTSRIELYNTLGEMVLTQTNLNPTNIIDLSNYGTGLYILKVINKDNSFISQKVIRF